jgi:DNA-directed RNA polymerase subunit alpha
MSQIISLPSKLKIVQEEGFSGTYEVEGLYPGYGHTLGNSLRRIILSSIPGAAITEVKIEGVDHEYSTLEGLKEDVLSLVLSLKRVRFKMLTDEPQIAKLSVTGEKAVTAGDIEAPGQLEVLNPEEPLATLTDKKSKLVIEMKVERGLGFVAKNNSKAKKEKVDIGVIALDAVYTPVRKVSYEVENMRSGDQTNFNRLRISIQTDGTLTPREAFEFSIKTMMEQLRAVLDLKEQEDRPTVSAEEIEAEVMQDVEANKTEADSEEDYNDALKTRIESLELSTRVANALSEASIRTVGGLVKKTEDELLELEGLGGKGVEEIKEALAKFNLDLKA